MLKLSRSLRVTYADCTGESLKKVNEARYKISIKYLRRKRYSRFVPSSIMHGNINFTTSVHILLPDCGRCQFRVILKLHLLWDMDEKMI